MTRLGVIRQNDMPGMIVNTFVTWNFMPHDTTENLGCEINTIKHKLIKKSLFWPFVLF